MAKFIMIFFLFIGFTGNAQTFLGKSKEDIYNKYKSETSKGVEISDEISDDSISIITINHDYEVLNFFMVDDVCVKFVVSKPYSCNCLSTDIMAYNAQLTPIGKMKWVSKDLSKLYELTMDKKTYSVAIALNDVASIDEGLLSSKD